VTRNIYGAQIVHRDLKSANILLARDGGACIAERGRGRAPHGRLKRGASVEPGPVQLCDLRTSYFEGLCSL